MSPETGRKARLASRVAVAASLALVAFGCRQDMHDQPRIKPLGANDFFENGQGARQLPEGTVARGHLREDAVYFTGYRSDGELVAELPVAVDRDLLTRGRQRYDIFCAPCHGRTGEGRGMVVRRGFKQPASYHVDRLRQAPVGYFFDVMTNGFGVMPSYAAQIPVADRWAIAAYVRTLQLSRHFDASRLSAEDRSHLGEPFVPGAPPAAPAAAGNEAVPGAETAAH